MLCRYYNLMQHFTFTFIVVVALGIRRSSKRSLTWVKADFHNKSGRQESFYWLLKLLARSLTKRDRQQTYWQMLTTWCLHTKQLLTTCYQNSTLSSDYSYRAERSPIWPSRPSPEWLWCSYNGEIQMALNVNVIFGIFYTNIKVYIYMSNHGIKVARGNIF